MKRYGCRPYLFTFLFRAVGEVFDKFNVGLSDFEIGFDLFAGRSGHFDLDDGIWCDRSTCGLKKFRKFGMILVKAAQEFFN